MLLVTSLVLLAAAAPLLCQKKAQEDQEPATATSYDLRESRAFFRACDLNGDDRIKYLEALKTLAHVEDTSSFQTWDTDRDGAIGFHEFDRQFGERTRLGRPVRILPAAAQRLPMVRAAASLVPQHVRVLFARLDKDRNDRVDVHEWSAVAALAGEAAPERLFRELDEDFTNDLSIHELRGFLEKASPRERETPRQRPVLVPLPRDWQTVDLDSSGLIDLQEFQIALQRIHPSLVQHARTIFEKADAKSKLSDLHLNAFEIEAALSGERKTLEPRGR